jgi:cytochrome c oxidase assembly protein subunit 15
VVADVSPPSSSWRRLGRIASPGRFPQLVVVTWVALLVNVASGALVRVSNSGLGCPDWPLCNGRPAPPMAGHAVIEFSNRVLAAWVIGATLVMTIAAWRGVRRADPWLWRLALVIGAGTLAQGPLGGITVLVGLHPIAVMSHFLLAVVIFSVATVLLVDVRGVAAVDDAPAWLRPAVVVFATWALLLIVSGAVVTMSGTHPGADNVRRLWNLLDATYWHVRIAVSFVVVLALFLYAVSRLDRHGPRVPRLAWAVVALTGLQVVIGEAQWRDQLPWWLVLAHVANATLLWSAVVALGRTLLPRRP